MRIQLFSDLHLERDPTFEPLVHPGTDVVVLAGDIGSYQARSRLQDEDFGLARFSPRRFSPAPRVLYVPGNHEFDSLEYEDAYERLQRVCAHLGIEWLDGQTVVIDGVRFIGSTLWADFDAVAGQETELAKQLQARGKAFRAANYYLARNTTFRQGEPVLAEGQRVMS